jgi:hypothetical protein
MSEENEPTAVDWQRVRVVTFYAVVTGLITLLAAWGSSDTVSWIPALKAAAVAAAGYVAGKLHR